MASARFRYDDLIHEYFDLEQGDIVPHITGMLEQGGYTDSTWFTEESSERGTRVHDLTAQYDLGALEFRTLVSAHRAYVAAHVAAMQIVRPSWTKVEEPSVHPVYHYGGRPDRVGTVYSFKAVAEIKTGAPDKAHGIQLALQAILECADLDLPAPAVARFAFYYKPTGKFSVEQFDDRGDFDRAYDLIRRYCR